MVPKDRVRNHGLTSYSQDQIMIIFQDGGKSRAFCTYCADVVDTTFRHRDVPFSDGSGLARTILVGGCDSCQKTVAIPAQSTPSIASARKALACSTAPSVRAMRKDVGEE
jgi:hypothetical protein